MEPISNCAWRIFDWPCAAFLEGIYIDGYASTLYSCNRALESAYFFFDSMSCCFSIVLENVVFKESAVVLFYLLLDFVLQY